MISGVVEASEAIMDVVIFDWITGQPLARLLPDRDGEWSYDGELPPYYGILYRADKCAPRVEGPYQ
ncbi:MAG: hypothetical protein H7842_10690 [Gammaproteobacteria bacterium SHHR-1]